MKGGRRGGRRQDDRIDLLWNFIGSGRSPERPASPHAASVANTGGGPTLSSLSDHGGLPAGSGIQSYCPPFPTDVEGTLTVITARALN